MRVHTGDTASSVVPFAPKRGSRMPLWWRMMPGVTSLPWCKRRPIWRKQTASEPWMSPIAFLPSCEQPKKEPANLRQRQTTFGTVPLMRKNGLSAFTVRSSRRSSKKMNSSNAPCEKGNEATLANGLYADAATSWEMHFHWRTFDGLCQYMKLRKNGNSQSHPQKASVINWSRSASRMLAGTRAKSSHLLTHIPLGLRPTLHWLRSRSLRFVRRLHSYYSRVRLLAPVHHRLRLLTFPMRTANANSARPGLV